MAQKIYRPVRCTVTVLRGEDQIPIVPPKTFLESEMAEEARTALLKSGHIEFIGISEGGEAPTPVVADPDKKSKWRVDPDTLRGLSLEDVNIRILEIDSTVEPFEDLDEAIAFASQDFTPKG